MCYEFSNMTWREVKDRMLDIRLVVVQVGSVEQHCHHMGVVANWTQAWEIAIRVRERSRSVILPVFPYGVSGHHREFPGGASLLISRSIVT